MCIFVCSTSVADIAYGGRGEEDNSLLEQGQLPEREDVDAKEVEELREAANRVMNQLQGSGHMMKQRQQMVTRHLRLALK